MRYAYMPGCSLHSTAKEYNISTREVARKLGIELVEIPDWNCCGASSAHSTNHLLSLALPARNLAIAESMDLDTVIPCAACFNRSKTVQYEVVRDKAVAEKVNRVIGMEYRGSKGVYSLPDVFVNKVGLERIKGAVTNPLKGLRVAAYYGCLLVRPQGVTQFDDPENPQTLDRLIEALGGEPVDWPFKTECCGAGLAVPRTDIVLKLVNDILSGAKGANANCIITACPLCQSNLDMRQHDVNRRYNVNYNLPVYYFTQLLGVAIGCNPGDLSLETHCVNALSLLQWKKVIPA